MPSSGGRVSPLPERSKYKFGYFCGSMLKKGIEMLGPERILFGNDFPVVNPGMYVTGVFFEHLTETERKMVLRKNFLRLTGYSL